MTQGYDNRYRKTSIVSGSILNLTYGYDANGNITSVLDSINPSGSEALEIPEVYTYQQGTNKLTHTEGTVPVNYGYDANGNITSENTWTYLYDLSNRLVRLEENSETLASICL